MTDRHSHKQPPSTPRPPDASSDKTNLRSVLQKWLFGYYVLVAFIHLYMNALGIPLLDAFSFLVGEEALNQGARESGGIAPHIAEFLKTMALPPPLLKNALHFALFVPLCMIAFPFSSGRWMKNARLALGVDISLGVLLAVAALFLMLREDAIYARGVNLSAFELWVATFLIFFSLEPVRRTTGWIIPVLILLALSYATWLGPLLSGVFRFSGISYETLVFRSIYSDEGMFGTIASISSGTVMMFILFGAFLVRSGAGDFIVGLARVLAGRLQGGPGLIAVMASALTGTISGSAVANTAQTGTITIPLMIRSGYRPQFAAGVEAAASTGGQIMPPIMGAGAFIMANYTQIPYATIIAVSALPALLYFLSVGFYVRIEAKRLNITLPEVSDQVPFLTLLKEGGLSFIIPIGALVFFLVQGLTPTYAAGLAIVAVVVGSWLTQRKMGIMAIMEAMALGVKNMILTATLLVVIGLFVNVIPLTGVGNTVSLMINTWAGGDLLIAFVLIALASLVLGMGLPVTAAYVVLAVLSAPALYQLLTNVQITEMIANGTLPEAVKASFMLIDPQLLERLSSPLPYSEAQSIVESIPPDIMLFIKDQALSDDTRLYALLSAHMIIFWLSQDSNVTPPVCLTAFTAAAIAGTPAMQTGFTSWKVAKGLYLIPLLFAYTPFLGGSTGDVLTIFFFGMIGLYAFSAAFQGYLESPLSYPLRALAIVCGIAMLYAEPLSWKLVATALFIALFAYSFYKGRQVTRISSA